MKQFLTMADLAARRGVDKEVGLVDQIVNQAPEVRTIIGRPVPGTFSTAKILIDLPKGGAFRAVNQGVSLSAGKYERRRMNAFFFDAQLQVDEAELLAADQEGDSLGDLQQDEVNAALRWKSILFSQQFYSGADANGYPGLSTLLAMFNGSDGKGGVVDSRTGKAIVNTVSAGSNAATASTECVWYVWAHPQGVHFLFGGNKTVDINPWVWQYVADPNDPTKRMRASCSNIAGWIGLACFHPFAVACIKNIDANNAWTDALSAKLHALLPEGVKPTFCFATKRARSGLQQSRTVTLMGQAGMKRTGGSEDALIAPVPTVDEEGVPIIVTDGIQLQKSF